MVVSSGYGRIVKIRGRVSKARHYLGYVFVNQDSLFKRIMAGCLPQICIVSKNRAIIESSPESSSETNNPFYDLLEEYYDVAIINDHNYGIFLTHAIISIFQDTKNISFHVNAIYPQSIDFSSDNIIVTPDKIDYLKNDGGKHKKWSAIFGTTEYNVVSFKKLIDDLNCNIVYNVVVKGPDQLHPEIILFDVIGGITATDGSYYDFTLGFRLPIGGHHIELVTAY